MAKIRKSVAKALANQRRRQQDERTMRGEGKSDRKARKQMVEETYGHVPIR